MKAYEKYLKLIVDATAKGFECRVDRCWETNSYGIESYNPITNETVILAYNILARTVFQMNLTGMLDDNGELKPNMTMEDCKFPQWHLDNIEKYKK